MAESQKSLQFTVVDPCVMAGEVLDAGDKCAVWVEKIHPFQIEPEHLPIGTAVGIQLGHVVVNPQGIGHRVAARGLGKLRQGFEETVPQRGRNVAGAEVQVVDGEECLHKHPQQRAVERRQQDAVGAEEASVRLDGGGAECVGIGQHAVGTALQGVGHALPVP